MPESLTDPTHVVVVDDDDAVRGAIVLLLQEEGYACSSAAGAEAALQLLKTEEPPLVISDMRMPGHDGMWLLERIREEHPDTSVIMLTAFGDTEAAVDCLRRGAVDYLLKPPRVTNLVRAVERALSRRRLELARQRYQRSLEQRVREKTAELSAALREIETAYANTLNALVAALDAREHETSDHSQRVVRYTLAVARRMGFTDGDLPDLSRGALLHDIGKIGVPDAILLKPGGLTQEEWVEMRKHPQTGFTILQPIPFLSIPAEIVLAHQERIDGGGYPRGLMGDSIPIGARIFSIADTFDAITSNRPYRKGATVEAAREEIRRCRGSQFDRECSEAFLSFSVEELAALARPSPRP
ncbi:MAG TPA: HD domain-containing phosphohydrolase [Anaeromyxobacteraceae bacterium]|nr:HD domain-containing phosphohydrolase [Anaeromyxobacteraceae bacterium]